MTTRKNPARKRIGAATMLLGAAMFTGAMAAATPAQAERPTHQNVDLYQDCIAAGEKTPAYCCAMSGGIWIQNEDLCVPPPPPPTPKPRIQTRHVDMERVSLG